MAMLFFWSVRKIQAIGRWFPFLRQCVAYFQRETKLWVSKRGPFQEVTKEQESPQRHPKSSTPTPLCVCVRVNNISEFLKKMFLNKKIPHSDSKSNYHSPKTVIFKKSPKKNVGSNRKKLNAKRCLDHFVVIQVRTYIIRGLNISGVSWRWFCFSENQPKSYRDFHMCLDV